MVSDPINKKFIVAEVAKVAEVLPFLSKLPQQKNERIRIMAHYKPTDGFGYYTGALSKKKTQGVNRITVTRRKKVKDPITGEVVGLGPKEIFVQYQRDYEEHPLTPAEQAQRAKWRKACKEAREILKDKSSPRFMELYLRWRAQLGSSEQCKQFPNFVRAELVRGG